MSFIRRFCSVFTIICIQYANSATYLGPHGGVYTSNETSTGHTSSITTGSGYKYVQFPENTTVLLTETATPYGSTTTLSGPQSTIIKTEGSSTDPNSVSYVAAGANVITGYTSPEGVYYPYYFQGPNDSAYYDAQSGEFNVNSQYGAVSYNPTSQEGSISMFIPLWGYSGSGTFQYEGEGQGSFYFGTPYGSVSYTGSAPSGKIQVHESGADGDYMYSTGYDPTTGTITYMYIPYYGFYSDYAIVVATYNPATDTVSYSYHY